MIRKFLNRFPPAQVYRWFEIIPGALVWSTLMAAIALSIWWPLAAVYVIILFDLYWLLRVGYLVIWLLISWKKFRQALKIDWLAKMEEQKDWEKIWHLVVLPTYQEPLSVIQNTLRAFTKVKYPLDKFIFVLAGEARAGEHFVQVAEAIKQEFGPQFGHFLVTVHPANIVGEMAGKGANGHWAGKRAQELIDSLVIPYENVIVSNFDSDSCPHPQYFACLTYTFLTSPDPQHSSYQPVALYTNNMWESPAVTRVVAYSTTFWLLTDLARPERLFTFSSHSMPFRALVDVGFWQNDIVTEDSRIFLQCFVRYNGNYRVTPIYVPITMDTVYSGSLWNTLKNQYKQQRRWAYGVENFPYMAWHFWRSNTIPFAKKFRYVWNQLEGVYSWATAPLLIFILGRMPLYFADSATKSTLIAHSAPQALDWLMTIAMLGLFCSATLAAFILPPRPETHSKFSYIFMLLQWLLFPACMIIFGAIPAVDAQTRLMLGKYLGFWVTEKKRVV